MAIYYPYKPVDEQMGLDCLDCLDLHYSKPARRTRKRGTEQQARTRDPPRAKLTYTEFRTVIEHRTSSPARDVSSNTSPHQARTEQSSNSSNKEANGLDEVRRSHGAARRRKKRQNN